MHYSPTILELQSYYTGAAVLLYSRVCDKIVFHLLFCNNYSIGRASASVRLCVHYIAVSEKLHTPS